MTADKYTSFESKLEQMLKGIDANVQEVKGMLTSMYDRFEDLVDTAEATYKTVTYEQNGSHYTPDDDLDFLDEED
jgi:RNA polymerase-binding transcription factor DksA